MELHNFTSSRPPYAVGNVLHNAFRSTLTSLLEATLSHSELLLYQNACRSPLVLSVFSLFLSKLLHSFLIESDT